MKRRIAERFPDSALCEIATEFVSLARSASLTAAWLAKAHRLVRAAIWQKITIVDRFLPPADAGTARRVSGRRSQATS